MVTFPELQAFIDKEDARLNNHYGIDAERMKLARMVKLTEEVGELAEQVLAHKALQRSDKLEKREATDLPDEFADVILTTMLLAKTMDVDMHDALAKKIEKISKRVY
jgi:NTP pyrophosphatase (non-canonical NTP hydrolase)